ncbi:hypothetical protein B4Q13_20915, partial [Lacticaseibacillus rhamnosus]
MLQLISLALLLTAIAGPQLGIFDAAGSDHVIVCEDGDVVEVGERVKIVDRVQAGMTFVDGLGIGDVGGSVLRDRRKLAGDGVVVVVLTVDMHTGEG